MEYRNKNSFAARQKRVNLAEEIPLKKPLSINIETTTVCNFNCTFCFRNDDKFNSKERPRYMSDELIDKVLNDLKNWEGDKIKAFIMHVSGEPFATEGFSDIIKKIKSAEAAEQIQIFSNASLLSEEICKTLIESKIDYIRFSIYSVTQEKHRRITNNNIDINKIFENIKLLYNMRKESNSDVPYISTKFFDTFTDENELFIEKFKSISDEAIILPVLEIPSITPPLENTYGAGTKELELAKKQAKLDMNKEKSKCAIPFYKMVIYSNGNVGLCCDDFIGNLTIGNAFNENLKEIWNNEKAQEVRINMLKSNRGQYEVCANCNVFQNKIVVSDNIETLTPNIFLNRLEQLKKRR